MKTGLFILCFFTLFSFAQAQENQVQDSVKWKRNGSFNFGISNTGFSNWAAGGTNALAIATLIEGKITRKTQKTLFEMRWLMSYGVTRIGDNNQLFKKNDDQIIVGTEFGKNFAPKWTASIFGEFRSQFTNAYSYKKDPISGVEQTDKLLSRIFAPAYLLVASGVKYNSKYFTTSISPATGKFTLVLDDSLSSKWSFGQNPGEKMRSEIGTVINFNLAATPFENVELKSNLNLFSGYKQYIKEIDVNWEAMVILKVNKFLNVSFLTQLIYDQDIVIPQADGSKKQAIQFKHLLNVNLAYKFASASERVK